MSTPIVDGIIELGQEGSESTFARIQEFTLDRTQDYGEVQSKNNPLFAELIRDQKSWSATLTIIISAVETGDPVSDAEFEQTYSDLEARYDNGDPVNVVITYGDPNSDIGELDFEVLTKEAKGKIASWSEDGAFYANGEPWTLEIEITGTEPFTTIV